MLLLAISMLFIACVVGYISDFMSYGSLVFFIMDIPQIMLHCLSACDVILKVHNKQKLSTNYPFDVFIQGTPYVLRGMMRVEQRVHILDPSSFIHYIDALQQHYYKER